MNYIKYIELANIWSYKLYDLYEYDKIIIYTDLSNVWIYQSYDIMELSNI